MPPRRVQDIRKELLLDRCFGQLLGFDMLCANLRERSFAGGVILVGLSESKPNRAGLRLRRRLEPVHRRVRSYVESSQSIDYI